MANMRVLASAALMAAVAVCAPAHAGSVRIDTAGGSFAVAVTSMYEARWGPVVRQKYDFSCGSAAVATLLTYHYGRPTDEETVFQAMFEAGDQQKIRAHGFSLLDMKLYLDAQGLRSDGFRLSLETLAKIGVPGITLLDVGGYRHFVVVKGVERGRVLVGDPARGVRAFPIERFEAMWNGAFLAARRDFETARKHFNQDQEWLAMPAAPSDMALSRESLARLTIYSPGTL
jgi:predicted double-glycine peptidase